MTAHIVWDWVADCSRHLMIGWQTVPDIWSCGGKGPVSKTTALMNAYEVKAGMVWYAGETHVWVWGTTKKECYKNPLTFLPLCVCVCVVSGYKAATDAVSQSAAVARRSWCSRRRNERCALCLRLRHSLIKPALQLIRPHVVNYVFIHVARLRLQKGAKVEVQTLLMWIRIVISDTLRSWKWQLIGSS